MPNGLANSQTLSALEDTAMHTQTARPGRKALMKRITVVALSMLCLMSIKHATAIEAYQTVTPPSVRAGSITERVPDPDQPGVEWFTYTGHTLRGVFLEYWNRYGGLAQFGYPLTEEFFEESGTDKKLYRVQYFERARFEHHPEYQNTPYEVLLGMLGRELLPRSGTSPVAPQPPPATYFPESGHNLSGAFKQYWETHGGLFVHGFPLTEPFYEENLSYNRRFLVQYFERSRFEFHAENAGTEHEVLLGMLGEQLLRKYGYYQGYPKYGHAPDFSWIAGRFIADYRFCTPCGCDLVRYGTDAPHIWHGKLSVEPLGPVWDATSATYLSRRHLPIGPDSIREREFVVLFGHRPSAAEPSPSCRTDGYIVEAARKNMGP
jgi:hypothetical protein